MRAFSALLVLAWISGCASSGARYSVDPYQPKGEEDIEIYTPLAAWEGQLRVRVTAYLYASSASDVIESALNTSVTDGVIEFRFRLKDKDSASLCDDKIRLTFSVPVPVRQKYAIRIVEETADGDNAWDEGVLEP